MKKFYKYVGIDKYRSNTQYFIFGKVYERVEDPTDPGNPNSVMLIDELGDNHRMPSDIFETYFRPLSNKRHRNDKERR